MKTWISIIALTLTYLQSFGQQVGISNAPFTPDPSSILELKSTNRALIIPRLSRFNVPNPKEGMIVFDTFFDRFYYHDGTEWIAINEGLMDNDHDTSIEVGYASDNDKITFQAKGTDIYEMGVNANNVGYIKSFDNNVIIGKDAGNFIKPQTPGILGGAICIGQEAGAGSNFALKGIYMGYKAGFNSGITYGSNVLIGDFAGATVNPSTLFQSTGVGTSSLQGASGTECIALGSSSGSFSDGDNNIYLGTNTGHSLVGNNNILIGADISEDQIHDNKLIIEAFGAETPLISGDFLTDSVNIHNVLQIGTGIGSKLYIGNDYITDAGPSILRTNANFTPNLHNTYNLGGSSFKWKHVFMEGNLNIKSVQLKEDGDNILKTNSNFLPADDGAKDLGRSSNRWRWIYAANGTINTSDRRAKKNIEELNYGLDDILNINTVQYNWNEENDEDKKHLGVIAQEILKLIPEVVNVPENPEELLGVKYSDLIPILIKAIQEQQQEIESNNTQITNLLGQINRIEKNADSQTKMAYKN